MRLNLLYGHLLERGRVRGPGGLAPKTVQNVHRMLHRALRDAVKWDVIPRNVAEDASPPRVSAPAPDRMDARAARPRSSTTSRTTASTRSGSSSPPPASGVASWPACAEATSTSSTDESPQRSASGRRRASGGVGGQDRAAASAGWLSTPPPGRAPASTSSAGTRSESCSARTPSCSSCGQTVSRLHPDTITDAVPQALRGGGSAADPTARRPALLRHRSAQGRHLPQDHQRTARSLLAAFTLQTYTHVIPGMDESAANDVADLILAPARPDADGHGSPRHCDRSPQNSEEPADLMRFRRSAGSSMW